LVLSESVSERSTFGSDIFRDDTGDVIGRGRCRPQIWNPLYIDPTRWGFRPLGLIERRTIFRCTDVEMETAGWRDGKHGKHGWHNIGAQYPGPGRHLDEAA
jgi:hypothetical protein